MVRLKLSCRDFFNGIECIKNRALVCPWWPIFSFLSFSSLVSISYHIKLSHILFLNHWILTLISWLSNFYRILYWFPYMLINLIFYFLSKQLLFPIGIVTKSLFKIMVTLKLCYFQNIFITNIIFLKKFTWPCYSGKITLLVSPSICFSFFRTTYRSFQFIGYKQLSRAPLII